MKSYSERRDDRVFKRQIKVASDDELTELNNEWREQRRFALHRMKQIQEEREERLRKQPTPEPGQVINL